MSKFTVNGLTKLISDKIMAKLLCDLINFNDFSILTDESSDEAGRTQLAVFVHCIDPSTNESKEEYVSTKKT